VRDEHDEHDAHDAHHSRRKKARGEQLFAPRFGFVVRVRT
jgi:hypothetical protein